MITFKPVEYLVSEKYTQFSHLQTEVQKTIFWQNEKEGKQYRYLFRIDFTLDFNCYLLFLLLLPPLLLLSILLLLLLILLIMLMLLLLILLLLLLSMLLLLFIIDIIIIIFITCVIIINVVYIVIIIIIMNKFIIFSKQAFLKKSEKLIIFFKGTTVDTKPRSSSVLSLSSDLMIVSYFSKSFSICYFYILECKYCNYIFVDK